MLLDQKFKKHPPDAEKVHRPVFNLAQKGDMALCPLEVNLLPAGQDPLIAPPFI
jgi:hypothetical protein